MYLQDSAESTAAVHGRCFFSGQTIKDLTEDMSEIQYFMKYLGCYFGLTTPATS